MPAVGEIKANFEQIQRYLKTSLAQHKQKIEILCNAIKDPEKREDFRHDNLYNHACYPNIGIGLDGFDEVIMPGPCAGPLSSPRVYLVYASSHPMTQRRCEKGYMHQSGHDIKNVRELIRGSLIQQAQFYLRHYTPAQRDFVGEHYIPHQGIQMLLRDYLAKRKIQAEQLIWLNEPAEFDYSLIKNTISLGLKKFDTLFVVLQDEHGIHTTPIYIHRMNERVECLVLDADDPDEPSDGATELHSAILKAMKKANHNAALYTNTFKFQRDYFSCSTFTLKILKHLAKYGPQILDQIYQDRKSFQSLQEVEIRFLGQQDIPASLLKKTQYHKVVSSSKAPSLTEFLKGFSKKQLEAVVSKVESLLVLARCLLRRFFCRLLYLRAPVKNQTPCCLLMHMQRPTVGRLSTHFSQAGEYALKSCGFQKVQQINSSCFLGPLW